MVPPQTPGTRGLGQLPHSSSQPSSPVMVVQRGTDQQRCLTGTGTGTTFVYHPGRQGQHEARVVGSKLGSGSQELLPKSFPFWLPKNAFRQFFFHFIFKKITFDFGHLRTLEDTCLDLGQLS